MRSSLPCARRALGNEARVGVDGASPIAQAGYRSQQAGPGPPRRPCPRCALRIGRQRSSTDNTPFDRAESERRAGAALALAGRREEAVEHLVAAHRTARRLGARPLVERVTASLTALGERPDRRLGRRAVAQAANSGLTRREVEVVRLVAMGHTNREIARDLFLSPRTVEMHVGSNLLKLDCRSRADAARRASELGLLAGIA